MLEEFENFNLTDIVTPVNGELLHQMLLDSQYDLVETEFLRKGFQDGFDIGYEGPLIRKDTSQNLPFQDFQSYQTCP